MEKLIDQDGLRVDAVVPQCLDNQYITDETFDYMVAEGLDYLDPKVDAMRDAATRTELMRSLVYSSQVVIQRAYFSNSKFLYRHFTAHQDRLAFASLLRSKAVIPFLLRERSLREPLSFESDINGKHATEKLLEEVGDNLTCVRLGIDDETNEERIEQMMRWFGAQLSGLKHFGERERNNLAAELFADVGRLQEEGAWKKYDAAVDTLAKYAFDHALIAGSSGERRLARSDIYKNFLIDMGAGEKPVVHGRFLMPNADNPFRFEIKKFVDLVYNTNLPDRLSRFALTPVGMPSRLALQDDSSFRSALADFRDLIPQRELLDAIKRRFMAHMSNAMTLPLLKELQMADVVEIRSLPEWSAFTSVQADILDKPHECLEKMERFQEKLEAFHRALSKWYYRKHGTAKTTAKYAVYAHIVLRVGGLTFIVNSGLPEEYQVATGCAWEQISENLKGVAARLMVSFYDVGERQLDRERSYSMELLRMNEEVARDDILDLLAMAGYKDNRADANFEKSTADQGRK